MAEPEEKPGASETSTKKAEGTTDTVASERSEASAMTAKKAEGGTDTAAPEEKLGASETTAKKAEGNTDDSGVIPLIKNIGALVGVAVAAVGIWTSIQSLKDKAKAEEETAKVNLAAQQTQLQIAEKQLEQHSKDNDLQIQLHAIDLQHQDTVSATLDSRSRRDNLASLITHMLSNQSSAEGDIAVLFEHLESQKDNGVILKNALLARLESPKSKGEIELAMRLLSRLGVDAEDVLVQANRSAKSRYNEALVLRFETAYDAELARSPTINPDTLVRQMGRKFSSGSFLDGEYDQAIIDSYVDIALSTHTFEVRDVKGFDPVLTGELAAEVIRKSSSALLDISLRSNAKSSYDESVRLDDTCLLGIEWFAMDPRLGFRGSVLLYNKAAYLFNAKVRDTMNSSMLHSSGLQVVGIDHIPNHEMVPALNEF